MREGLPTDEGQFRPRRKELHCRPIKEDDDGCRRPRRRRRALGIRHLLAPDVRRILAHRDPVLWRPGGADSAHAPCPGGGGKSGSTSQGSWARSASACCCPAPRPCSSPPTRGGSFAACPAGCWRASCSWSRALWWCSGLAALYMTVGHLPVMAALFLGIKGAVLIIVLEALLRVSKRALHSAVHWIIAGLAFVAIFFLSVPYPVLILAAGLAGIFPVGRPKRRKDRDRAGWRFDVRHFEDGSDMDGCLVDAGAVADGSGRLRHSGADR